ncbi:hypothetical protein BU14_0022s0043 [Porphyra umbilicalis]|uniref:YqgF/RNase H-like domain-containing protein n=1 Tax=Porphyra umbilicalis TaxID=2786 RepID=A0A1X6PKE9_PORUM|nr:hypothetical protein BU14_0022s0043 [Porphyra umbilicalis]|eukprot:OSX81322.1 hypothetical protein BU14_0022s0043 [Porphyra umbilicalis]
MRSPPLLPLLRLYTSSGAASPPLVAFAARLPAGVRGPILGLDVGIRHVGIALSDPSRRWAFPHSSYVRGTTPLIDAAALSAVATTTGAVAVVAGYPLPTPGGVSPAANVDAYVAALAATGLGGSVRAVALADERWSSVRARRALGVGVGTGQGGRGGGGAPGGGGRAAPRKRWMRTYSMRCRLTQSSTRRPAAAHFRPHRLQTCCREYPSTTPCDLGALGTRRT